MHFSYFNSRSNPKKRNNKLIIDDTENNDAKSKNNIIFDKFVENITNNIKKCNLLSNENTQEINSSLSLKILTTPNTKSNFKTESNQIKSNSINYIRDSIIIHKNLKSMFTKKNKLKANLYNNNKLFNNINKNNKLYNSKFRKKLDSEKEPIYQNIYNNNNDDILKIKLNDFILSSKELFNKESKFNYKMKKIIQKLRFFNNISVKNNLNMPKIKDNINHNCCLSLKKIDTNKIDSYTMTNKKTKTINKNRQKSISINNSRYENKDDKNIKMNLYNFAFFKLDKRLRKSINKEKYNLRENNIKNLLLNNNIINRNWMNEQSKKIIMIENFLNERTLMNRDNRLSNIIKNDRNKNKNNLINKKIFKTSTINKNIEDICINLSQPNNI